jgi:hypothetical protein
MPRLRCYFAHPYHYKDTPEKYKIIKELISRRLKILDPFEKEKEVLKEFGVDDYYLGETYELARRIWTQDLGLISSAQVLLAWIPSIDDLFLEKKAMYHTLGTAMEVAEAYNKGKFIQIISPIHHPSFAVYADEHQYFESIDNWIWHRDYKWRRYKT